MFDFCLYFVFLMWYTFSFFLGGVRVRVRVRVRISRKLRARICASVGTSFYA